MVSTKRLGAAILLTLFVNPSLAMTDSHKSVVQEPNKNSVVFFKRQVHSNNSVENAVKTLLSRYPEKTAEFVKIAFYTYPDRYKEIIQASVKAQPSFVDDIIKIANELDVSDPTEIISIAVNAEPSYAEIATKAACKYSPEHFNEIVRTAVKNEPDSADQIAQKLVTAYPNKTMDILITTIKEVPYVGKYILDALLAIVQEDDGTSEEMIILTIEQLAEYPDAMDRLVKLAKEYNIEQTRVKDSALKGGIDEQSIAVMIKNHY